MLATFFKQNGKKVTFSKGDVIVDCNDENPNGSYLLEEGFVKAYLISERGNEHVHIIYKAGEIFPARWSFGKTKGGLTYIAMTEVTAWKVDKAELTNYLNKNPQELHEALDYINMVLNVFVNRVNDLEHNNAYLRVSSRIISLTKRFGQKENGGFIIQAPVTQHEIAASISLSRESVSREMSKLEQKGIIEYKNQYIFVKDFDKLQNEVRNFEE